MSGLFKHVHDMANHTSLAFQTTYYRVPDTFGDHAVLIYKHHSLTPGMPLMRRQASVRDQRVLQHAGPRCAATCSNHIVDTKCV